MKKPAVLLLGLLMILVLPMAHARVAHASFGAGDFLKTSGNYIRNNAGSGAITTLRGTNLGGWLAQEDWMNPLGEFALDRTGWVASPSTNSCTAGNALDGDNTIRWTTGAAQAGGESTATSPPAGAVVSHRLLDSGSLSTWAPTLPSTRFSSTRGHPRQVTFPPPTRYGDRLTTSTGPSTPPASAPGGSTSPRSGRRRGCSTSSWPRSRRGAPSSASARRPPSVDSVTQRRSR